MFIRKSEDLFAQDIGSLLGSFKHGIKHTWLINEKNECDDRKLPFALRHMVIEAGKSYPMHPKDCLEATYVLEGQGNIQSESREYQVKSGDLLVVDRGEVYSIVNSGEGNLELLSYLDLHPQLIDARK